MAEIINELQERLLPEYEQLKKFEICTNEQIRECIRRRESFYTKVTKTKKSLRDYADFILFEKKVHKWITEKEEQHGNKLHNLKNSIVYRILRLYRECLRIFPEEERFWQSYIKFCKKSVPQEVYGTYERMLTFHGDKPSLWCDAALWAYEYNLDMTRVKNIFFRGLTRHPASEALNKTFFDIMLERASNMGTECLFMNNTKSEQDIGLQQVELIYTNSKDKINKVEYFFRLLERCEEDKFKDITVHLQKQILDDIMQTYARKESLWDFLAQRELRGFSMNDLQHVKTGKQLAATGFMATMARISSTSKGLAASKEANASQNQAQEERATAEKDHEAGGDQGTPEDIQDTKESVAREGGSSVWQMRTLKRRIELCTNVYKTAVDTLRTTEMWTFYINAMLKLNQDMQTQPVLKRRCLAMAFKAGHASGLMSLDHYNTFIKMVLESPLGVPVAEGILKEAMLIYPKRLEIYDLFLCTYVVDNNNDKVYDIFQKANQDLGVENCVSLWRLTINFYKTRYDDCYKRLYKIYKEAVKQPYPAFSGFRAEFIDFCLTNMPMEKVRKEYDKLCQLTPPNLEMHRRMAKYEGAMLIREPYDLERWRLCHENACYYFGKTNVTVWHDYIKFERDHGEPKRISVLYDRAKDTLNPNLVDDFVTQHALLISMS